MKIHPIQHNINKYCGKVNTASALQKSAATIQKQNFVSLYYPINFKSYNRTQYLCAHQGTVQEIIEANNLVCRKIPETKTDFEPKDLINENAVVLANTQIYDKKKQKNIDCSIVFKMNEKDYGVVLVDKQDLRKKINNQEYIAAMYFNVVPKNNLKLFFANKLSEEKIQEVIDSQKENDYVTLIGGFINYESHRYINAGKKVGLSSLQLFKKFGIENLFYNAFPYKDANSPMPYYLRAQLKIIDGTEENILRETDNFKKRLVQAKRIPMMMPPDAQALNLAEKYNLLNKFFD